MNLISTLFFINWTTNKQTAFIYGLHTRYYITTLRSCCCSPRGLTDNNATSLLITTCLHKSQPKCKIVSTKSISSMKLLLGQHWRNLPNKILENRSVVIHPGKGCVYIRLKLSIIHVHFSEHFFAPHANSERYALVCLCKTQQ